MSKLWKAGENCGIVSEILTEKCGAAADETSSGQSLIETTIPRGIASDPETGDVYVVDQINSRIVQLGAWGEFEKAWGWGVADGSAELQVCTLLSGCKKGLQGSGAGQFNEPQGIAVDSTGEIYIVDKDNFRVQKFDRNGNFVLMFGGGVNKTKVEEGGATEAEQNLCTAESGDVCQAGSVGAGPSAFSGWPYTSFIAIAPDDVVYVGDKERVQKFFPSGLFQESMEGSAFTGKTVNALALDESGSLFVSFASTANVIKLSPLGGAIFCVATVGSPRALASDRNGGVYVVDGESPITVRHYDADCEEVEDPISDGELTQSTAVATGDACFSDGKYGVYLTNFTYANSFIRAYNVPEKVDLCPPPLRPPAIVSQYALSVREKQAVLGVRVNPRFWSDTTVYVEYGPADCIESNGWEASCVEVEPDPPGAEMEAGVIDEDVDASPIVVSGLNPKTRYVYRFVAESSGGGPVVGVGGEPGAEGDVAEFTTLPEPTEPITGCPNDAFRTGVGANLRDCRAYELVTPLEKDGGDVEARLNIVPFDARVDQASLTGSELTFSAYRAFENPKSAPFSSQYLTKRTATGWQTEAISAPQEGEAFVNPLNAIDNLYRAFSPDLSQSWLYTFTEPVLGEGGLAGHPNLYRRDNDTGVYEACTTALPQLDEEGTHGPQLQGFSANGELAVFRIENKLTSSASEKLKVSGFPIYQLYACAYMGSGPAVVRLVSALPDGGASELENTVGGPANEQFQSDQGRTQSLENAISTDGSKVFWTASSGGDAKDPGTLYVRHNPGAPPTASGACEESEPAHACTIEISAGPAARFWTAADDGSVAIFSEEAGPNAGDLFEYLVASDETLLIAEDVLGILGASEDATRIYFLSEADLDGAAVAGEPNLYLYDKGAEATSFIATLSERDASQGDSVPSPANPEPAWHTARVTPDGSAVAFMSNSADLAEEVAGYDNTDQNSGTPAAEIYRYAIGESLSCISCNRTGQRPRGKNIRNKLSLATPPLYAAAMLPPWLNALYAPRVLSDDGTRVFFESFESLSLADTNDKTDVYQWEAEGKGSCTTTDSAYDPQSEGCVSLLTSGKATTDARFVDASPSGNDVFIRTPSSLVSWDPGAIDIYDARVGGGFQGPPPPPDPNDGCSGETCQPPVTPAPAAPTPATGNGSTGNVVPKPTKPGKRCRKGTHKVRRKGRVVCVRNKTSRNQRR